MRPGGLGQRTADAHAIRVTTQRRDTRRICALEYNSEEKSRLVALGDVLNIVMSWYIPDGPGSMLRVEVAARLASAAAPQARAAPPART